MVKDDIKKANPKEEEPMKIYDKYMYKSQEKIKNIIAVFIIGFITGYASQINTISKLNKDINNVQENNSSVQND